LKISFCLIVLFLSEPNIKEFWCKLHRENPEMQRIFETVIGNLTEEMKRSKTDKMMLEEAFKSQSNSYDENLKKLYEEMESQMKAEKSKMFSQVSKKKR